MLEIIAKAVRNIRFFKASTILTIIGIAVGVSAVIIISNIGKCGTLLLNNEIDGLGMSGLSVTLKKEDAPLTANELESIREIPYVEYAMPVMFETTNAVTGKEAKQIYLWGIDQTAESVISLNLVNGRYFNTGDIRAGSRICMVDEKFAQESFGTGNILGKTIAISSGGSTEQYKVVGIIKTGSGLLQNVMGTIIPDFIYVPYSTMQSNMSSRNYTQIMVRTDGSVDDDLAQNDIIRHIERSSNRKNAYMISNLSRQKESINRILDIFSLVLSAIGAISLLVAGLNIMNVMLVSVSERTREIGIKKAIGAPRGCIIAEFLAEASVISLIGGAAGIVFGTAVSFAGSAILGLTVFTGIDIIISMMLFSLLIGTLFGIYPAYKASCLRPVDALRYF